MVSDNTGNIATIPARSRFLENSRFLSLDRIEPQG
jgi:hypothetical protein